MKFAGYVDPQKPNELVFLNLQKYEAARRPANNRAGTRLCYSYKSGGAILGAEMLVPVEFGRMQEIWNAADVAGDPTLSVSRVYPVGTSRIFSRSESHIMKRAVTKETQEDLLLAASKIDKMTVSVDSKSEDGKPMLTIHLNGEKDPIYAVGDFSPLAPYLMMADPSALQKMQMSQAAQIADETPPDIRQIGGGNPHISHTGSSIPKLGKT